MGRLDCYRCLKPQGMCLCSRVPRVDNRTTVLLLQHPRERLHPIGTARLANLGLSNVRLEVAWNAGVREDDPPPWLPPGTALLYPTPAAQDLPGLCGRDRPRHLLVLDGTWHTTRTLYRDKTWLQRLPHVRFSPRAPSNYRLRREPTRDHVSTIEAIVEALRVLEPETCGLDALLAAFDAMIDDQLAHVALRAGPRRPRKRRPAALRGIPEALVSGLERLVVVYAESVRADRNAERELVQVTAQRLDTCAERQWHMRPRSGTPSALLLSHMQLAPSDFADAIDVAAFRDQWQRFLSGCERPMIAAWNQSTLDLLARAAVPLPAPLLLKSAYRGRFGVEQASLDDVIAARGIVPAPSRVRGRAANRVTYAVAVARHLHALPAVAPSRANGTLTTALCR